MKVRTDVAVIDSEKLKKIIEDKGLSTYAFAKQIGVMPNTVTNWVKRGKMRMWNMRDLEKKIGLEKNELLLSYGFREIAEHKKEWVSIDSDYISKVLVDKEIDKNYIAKELGVTRPAFNIWMYEQRIKREDLDTFARLLGVEAKRLTDVGQRVRWVSTEDETPPDGEVVVVCDDSGGYHEAYWIESKRRWCVAGTGDVDYKFPYWMKRPVPPGGLNGCK